MQPKPDKHCATCGRLFEPRSQRGSPRRFCTAKCRKAGWERRQPLPRMPLESVPTLSPATRPTETRGESIRTTAKAFRRFSYPLPIFLDPSTGKWTYRSISREAVRAAFR